VPTTKTTAAPLFIHPSDLTIQTAIRLPLPIVEGNRDYREHEALLRRMDNLLVSSGAESAFLAAQVAAARTDADDAGKPLTDRMRNAVQENAKQALSTPEQNKATRRSKTRPLGRVAA